MRKYFLPIAVTWLPIVPCGSTGQDVCTPCHLFQALHNAIDLVLYGITGPVAAFMIVLAGGMMLLSAGNARLYSQGKTILKNTLIGVAIILLSWVFVNFLIKSLEKGNTYDSWYEFTCPAFLQVQESALPSPVAPQGNASSPAPDLVAAEKAGTDCEPATLATAFHVPNNEKLNSSSLVTMMSCIEKDPIVKALAYTTQDQGKFTYEISNPLCNLTRGAPVCGSCAHAKYSCHYDGHAGNQGAMAVDYNWKKGVSVTYEVATRTIISSPTKDPRCQKLGACRSATGQQGLFDEIRRAVAKNGCDYKFLYYEVNHTHVSTADCDSDGKGIKGPAPLP